MKKHLVILLLVIGSGYCYAQPAFNGKQLIDVTTITNWNFAARPTGWYRIATVSGGGRGNATFELRDDADHTTLRFEVGLNYNTQAGSSLTITNHSYYSAATFPKIRLISADTYANEYLEVYVDPHNNDNQPFYAYLIHAFADGDWTLINWTAGAVPAGYTAAEFDTNQLFTVGNIPNKNILSVSRNGYVGIGTTTPHEALSVNGNIRSKEVKVETANWPDYVFEPAYNLPSLNEVKTYIDKNSHLPEIPSAQEVEKDGLNRAR